MADAALAIDLFKSSELKIEREIEQAKIALNEEYSSISRDLTSRGLSHSSGADWQCLSKTVKTIRSLLLSRFSFDKETINNQGIAINNEIITQLKTNIDDTLQTIQNNLLDEDFWQKFSESGSSFKNNIEEGINKAVKDITREIDIFAMDSASSSNTLTPISDITTPSFDFIQSEELKSIVERDYRELTISFRNGLHKATLVMAGSVLEGLLLDTLLKQNNVLSTQSANKKERLEKWSLDCLLKVSVELKLIDATVEGMATPIRQLRNLIHPGNEFRKQTIFDEKEAIIAFNVVNIVIRNLSSQINP